MRLEILKPSPASTQPVCAIKLCLQAQSNTLVTHEDLALLRRCANALQMSPNRIVNVVAESDNTRARYVIKTLLHLGVSIGQITLNSDSCELQA